MSTALRLPLAEIETRVCDVASVELGIARHKISPASRLIEDLHCDSLDLIEFFMELEEAFQVTLPGADQAPNSVYKSVFIRPGFRLQDMAELVYLQQGTGTPQRTRWLGRVVGTPAGPAVPFTQLGGRWRPEDARSGPLWEHIVTDGPPRYRRRSDGMRCVVIPGAEVEIGSDAAEALADERPLHRVEIEPFLVDAEPVSTTAYCRFLNSIGEVAPEHLADWFTLAPDDDRVEHQLVCDTPSGWRPVPGAEDRPMVLVSWYGANAYSLWANGRAWTDYRAAGDCDGATFLPTEAQWEYAARGARQATFPWGNRPPADGDMRHAQHRQSAMYRVEDLPLAAVNEQLGLSPFGLHHMAGNVWQWCRDWYDPAFYGTPQSRTADPCNRQPTGVRSERGGSWVGRAQLCRSSHRRARNPYARGRCLGFRCVARVPSVVR